MQMSNSEIVQSYKTAKKRGEQVRILAELNCCQKEDIIAVLEKNGITPDKRLFSTTPQMRAKAEKETPVKVPVVYEENKEVAKFKEEKKKMTLPTIAVRTLDKRTREMQIEIDSMTEQIAKLTQERKKLEEEFTDLVTFLEGVETGD